MALQPRQLRGIIPRSQRLLTGELEAITTRFSIGNTVIVVVELF